MAVILYRLIRAVFSALGVQRLAVNRRRLLGSDGRGIS